MYKTHSCTSQFQPDIREGAPREDSASEEVDPIVGADGGVKDGGSSREATLEGHAERGSCVENAGGGWARGGGW